MNGVGVRVEARWEKGEAFYNTAYFDTRHARWSDLKQLGGGGGGGGGFNHSVSREREKTRTRKLYFARIVV